MAEHDLLCESHPDEIKKLGFGGMLYCEKCVAEIDLQSDEDLRREDEERLEKKKLAIKENRWKSLDIGIRFKSKSFDDYTPDNPRAEKTKKTCLRFAETFSERLADGDNLLMLGKAGTGKNHLSASICRKIIDDGFFPVHTTAIKLVRSIKDSWNRRGEKKEQEIIDGYVEPDLLVIDEVGVQFGSQTELIYLMDIINTRYAEMKPTILISNLDVKKLTEILGEPIISRFYEGKSAVLIFDWEDYRRKKTS